MPPFNKIKVRGVPRTCLWSFSSK